MTHGSSYRNTVLISVAGVTGLVWGLRFLPYLIPQGRVWGVNHLLFLPPVYLWIYAALGIIILSLFFRPVAQISNRVFGSAAAVLLERPFPKRWLFAAVCAVIFFWFLKLPVYLLGDSFSVTANISNDLPVIYKWSEIGSIFMAVIVSKIIPVAGAESGVYAYGVISVLSGGATIFLLFALAYELGNDRTQRLFIFCLTLFAGWTLLFFGYTENYPVLWPFITGYVYFGIRYLRGKNSLIVPFVFLAASMVLHLQIAFFIFSFILLLFSRGLPARLYENHKKIILSIIVLGMAGAAVLFYKFYQQSLELQIYLMPLFVGHGATAGYTLFSIDHLLDIGNQLLLLMPAFPVLLILSFGRWRKLFTDRLNQFLILLSLGGFAFLFIIEPRLGMGRDWDLFALAGLAPLLLVAKIAIERHSILSRFFPVIIIASLTMIMPYLAVNMNYDSAVENYKFLLSLDRERGRTGVTNLIKMYDEKGDKAVVDSLKVILRDHYPAATLAPTAYELIDQRRYDEALIISDSLFKLDPYSIENFLLRASILIKQEHYARAIQDLETAADLGRYDSRPLIRLAQAYNQLGQFEKMMMVLRKAQQCDAKSFKVAEGLSSGFYSMGRYDSALVYAQKMIEVEVNNPAGYIAAGLCAQRSGNLTLAESYLTNFLRLDPANPLANRAKEILASINRAITQ
ncbi:MAG: hypothetical protein V3V99_06485 [candidate division Zixibacteria bacterium]